MLLSRLSILGFMAALSCTSLHAEEGMWTFDHFPTAAVRSTYNIDINQAWLDRVRLATVRLSGCTGSFVSPSGLVLTNHHCSTACLRELSTATENLFESGFVINSSAEERKCPRQIGDVLVEMENITSKIKAATQNLNDQAANDARRKALTTLEEQCEAGSKQDGRSLKCESVSLYEGGQYFLYKYHRYTDVRLVFAPEASIAAFGGDPDNFQFPRWCLDMSILRIYENGQPIEPANFLRINFAGAKPHQVVFASGHPGSTQRLMTVDQLIERRNSLPAALMQASELRGRYLQYAKTGAEQSRIVDELMQGVENGIKVRRKQLDALLDERLMSEKRNKERAFQNAVAKNRNLAADTLDAWKSIQRANALRATIDTPYNELEAGQGFQSQLFRHARTLVRGTTEREKPNADRLREYADARLPRIEQQLQAKAPIYSELEILTLSFSLERMRELLGPDHKVVRELMAHDSPDALAAKLVNGSTLADPEIRMKLWLGGQKAVNESHDPMIELARVLDSDARALRKEMEDRIEAPIRVATTQIAGARFAVYGTRQYPDATFTLRLNYGEIKGWKENAKTVPEFTKLATLFERATGADPFRIPGRWLAAKAQLDLDTPFNMSTTNDIVGGNSGSPLINAQGEVVGLLFDGNIHSISGAFWYDTQLNRAVAVHPAIIKTALEKVYRTDGLLKELMSSH